MRELMEHLDLDADGKINRTEMLYELIELALPSNLIRAQVNLSSSSRIPEASPHAS